MTAMQHIRNMIQPGDGTLAELRPPDAKRKHFSHAEQEVSISGPESDKE